MSRRRRLRFGTQGEPRKSFQISAFSRLIVSRRAGGVGNPCSSIAVKMFSICCLRAFHCLSLRAKADSVFGPYRIGVPSCRCHFLLKSSHCLRTLSHWISSRFLVTRFRRSRCPLGKRDSALRQRGLQVRAPSRLLVNSFKQTSQICLSTEDFERGSAALCRRWRSFRHLPLQILASKRIALNSRPQTSQ